jgi:hypothetical protein
MPAPTTPEMRTLNDIVVEEHPVETEDPQTLRQRKLVEWVISHVEKWEEYRDNNFRDLWDEYYRAWKQVYTNDEKTRSSERSKFMSPALPQAIEMAVAEAEEATFGRTAWIDIEDDIRDDMKQDMMLIRDQLLEDMELNNVPEAVVEAYLNGALYGTGIGKIIVQDVTVMKTDMDGMTDEVTYTKCALEPICPEDFAIDPEARTIDEALGCAHIVVRPKHSIQKKQSEGIYEPCDLGEYVDDRDVEAKGEIKSSIVTDKVEIVEYHGYVPSFLMEDGDEAGSFDMTEAIITIANRQSLLKETANPFDHKDRAIIAFQWDKVPNRFWGRGVAEKGINSQRALNAELRARQDGLALTIHPMMAVDATRIPRGNRLEIAPGKTILTNGDPKQILNPMHFGEMSSHTYQQASEIERMLSMATGTMDMQVSNAAQPRNATASGMSMMVGGSIKRSKRTMQNIERQFLKPMIKKMIHRYMQFDPFRYPGMDYKFLPHSTMGIMAREFTQAQIAQAMQVTPPDSQAFGILLSSFFDNSSLPNKEAIQQQIQEMYNRPPDPMQQQMAMLELEKLAMEVEKLKSEATENYAQAESKVKQTEVNAFNAIATVEDKQLDRDSYGKPNG